MTAAAPAGDRLRVALFVTCLVDLFRPSVGFAAARLLEAAGCEPVVPDDLTCCGQPAYNAGDRDTAAALARAAVRALEPFAAVVVPSGSCAGMMALHYPRLLADDAAWAARARAVASRTFELTAFLHRRGATPTARHEGAVAYHDSCSSLREVGVRHQPRALLKQLAGLELRELRTPEACCGFGGTFCVKYPEISDRMASEKCDDVAASGAPLLTGGDLGCLMNLAGKLQRLGVAVRVRHVAELLAGSDSPAIGEAAEG